MADMFTLTCWSGTLSRGKTDVSSKYECTPVKFGLPTEAHFSNHVVKINGCCVFLFTVLLQKQHWITLTWVLPCDFLMKSRFQLCKHREKLYENYVNEITWYRWPVIHKTSLKCCSIWLVRKAGLDWDLLSGANQILGDSAMGRHIGKHRTRHRDINYHHTKDV